MSESGARKRKIPLLLWPPNLIGYVRVLTLVAAMLQPDPASSFAVWMVTASLVYALTAPAPLLAAMMA